jgi:hypothetical protein
MATPFRVFIAESNDPESVYLRGMHGAASHAVLLAGGVSNRYRVILNKKMLIKAIGEAKKYDARVFHLACHGDSSGIRLSDYKDIFWDELADLFNDYADDRRILVNSSCGGGHGSVAEAFEKSDRRFGYILGSTTKDVTFYDLCIASSILYNEMANDRSISRSTLRQAIDKINRVVDGKFVYRRWDDDSESYKIYRGKQE